LLGYTTSHLTRGTVTLRALESMVEKWATRLSPKKKDSKLIATLPPSPLQHDQHYVDIMFTLSAAHTLMQIATYISAKLNASYSRNPISNFNLWIQCGSNPPNSLMATMVFCGHRRHIAEHAQPKSIPILSHQSL
jgi:hypothetical protein